MLQQSPRLTGICNERRPGTVRCNCFHRSCQSKIVTVPTASSSYHQGFRWPRMGLRVWNAVLLVCLSFLLAPESMEAFLRPASAYPPLLQALQKGPLKVSLVGSGNWGTAVGKIVAANAKDSHIFNTDVRMWVFEEEVEGRKLTDWINNNHENRKYLPGFELPSNLRAVPSLTDACRDADLLVFVMPHQFIEKACRELKKAQLLPPHTRAISLIKGIGVRNGWPITLTHEIGSILDLPKPCILSGANVASDVAAENFAEATIGHPDGETETAALWQLLFDRPNFKINVLPDVDGVEVCGALKNVVALAGGFCEGMGQGTNTKAAILRLGVEEIKTFIMTFFGDLLADTLYDSAGYADVITTVFGGRNSKVAAEFVRQKGKGWDELEREMLNGQKLQGPATLELVAEVIRANEVEHLFPLFMSTYRVAFEGADPQTILDVFRTKQPRSIQRSEDCVKLKVPTLVQDARNRIASRLRKLGRSISELTRNPLDAPNDNAASANHKKDSCPRN
ncbi:glycerol-3-phosphate dehydrogenase, putative [Eimeria necatrix]|uniref:Glycerol-3-phosphate dehydrogenase [NAD(+)] n=1 Tax=Eimeria necatrix TaxID=51315 RepID=U6MEH2_9EIME|nr:glycerol-3-phosphate dehydrogenase, putative [Eimeria necatrix]CDJ62426.1 glycerol-3-phosphate dehydrogenase, putative [Eimeria necatrix]